jgi:hypothetical protein
MTLDRQSETDAMTDSPANTDVRGKETKPEAAAGQPKPLAAGRKKKRANMHEGIGVWADCCSCEAEPRWVEVAEELGIDLSEYEDDKPGG